MKNELMSHDPCPAVKFAVTNLFWQKPESNIEKKHHLEHRKKHFLATLKYLDDYLTCFFGTFQHGLQIASNDVPAFRFPPSGWHWPKDVPSSCHRSVCNTLGQRLHNCRNAEPSSKGWFKTETTNKQLYTCSIAHQVQYVSGSVLWPTSWSWRLKVMISDLTWPSVSNKEISGRSTVYSGPIHQHMGCTCVPVNVSNHIRNYQPQTRIINVS